MLENAPSHCSSSSPRKTALGALKRLALVAHRLGARSGSGWRVAALALVGIAVVLGAPTGFVRAATSPCPDGTTLNVVAHEDDDLLFLSPDVLHDVQSDRCVTTVYLTAGDDGDVQSYWEGREAGVEAAYASMAGVPDSWTQSTLSVKDSDNVTHSIVMQNLDGDQNVSLIFMRLPDGKDDGSGFPSDNNESLKKLWTGNSSTRVHPVDGSSTSGYSKLGLESVLTSFMNQFQPDIIRTQDYVNTGVLGANDDHSDHQATGLLTYAAQQTYTTPHTIRAYYDYESPNYPQNVYGADLAAKQDTYYLYDAYDPHVNCTSQANCEATYAAWLERQYTVPFANAGPDRMVTTGTTVQLLGSSSFDQYDKTLSYQWAQTGGPDVSLSSTTVADPTFSAPASPATLTFSLTVGDGVASSTDSVTIDVVAGTANIANQATVTASSQNTANDQGAGKAVDGYTDGGPIGDPTHEWATNGGKAGSWLKLTWNSAQAINHVVLYDRPNGNDQITGGTLSFSSGGNVAVPSLNDDGSPVTVNFPARSTTTLTLTINSVSSTTTNVGLAEIEVWTDRHPVADAGPDQTVYAGDSVTLNGSQSFDPDSADTISYAWTQIGTPSVTLSGANTGNPTFTAPVEGTSLTFQLTVTDDGMLSDSDTVTVTVTPKADLQITKNDSPDPVRAAESLTYTLAVSNAGPSTATSVSVVDPLPTGTSYVSASGTGWSCGVSSGTVTCTRASLAVGAAPNIQIQITAPNEGGQISNTATVFATEYDPVAGNNSSTQATTVTPKADLQITKSDSPDPVRAAESLTYTLAVSNAGPSTATSVSVVDPLPTGTSYVSASGTGWSCGVSSGTVTCTRASLAVGAAPNIQIQITAPNEGGQISNTATVSATEYDPVAGNNSSTQATTVTPKADLRITKTDGVDKVNAGDAVTYTIVVSNDGPSAAPGAVFTDAAVANLDVSTVICGYASPGAVCPSVSNTTVALMQGAGIVIPTLPKDGSVTFTVTGTADTAAQIANVASVAAPAGTFDPSSQNSTAVDTDAVNRPPVANAGPDQNANPGDTVRLDGTASSDPDHDAPLSYEWTQTAGPSVSLSFDDKPSNPIFTAPDNVSTLTFKLKVSDPGGLSSDDSVTINVNRFPTADAGPDQYVNAGDLVWLDGTKSSDPDHLSLTYQWTQKSGSVAVTLSDATSPTPIFTAPAGAASLTFTLTVNNGALPSDPDDVTIYVNRPPVADAGPDQSVNTSTSVTLDGSGSTDPDLGDTLSYLWQQQSGTAVTLSSDTAKKPTFTAPNRATSLVFKLTVSDGVLTSSDTVAVNVPDRAPVANAGPDQSVKTSDQVTLDGSGSNDPDLGDALTYTWAQQSGTAVMLSSDTAQKPTFTAPSAAGTLVFKLTVSDGPLTSSDTVAVNVTARVTGSSGSTSAPKVVYKRLQTTIVKATIFAKKHMAVFKFKGSGGKGKLHFQCNLDKGKFKSCVSGKRYLNLKRGKHVFRVRAKDARSKVDTTPAVKRFKIRK
jgi:uncharacterized repeat protein (TIGR01451 family)